MHKLLAILLALEVVISSPTTPVKKCQGDVKGELFKKVVVSTPKGICTKLPCNIFSGKNVQANITFEVRKEVSQITMKCNATAFGAQIQYPLPNATKGCDFLTNTYCPISPGTEAELSLTMNVNKIFPKVSVDLVFFLLDQSSRMISCFEITAKVVDGFLLNLLNNVTDNN